VETAKNLEYTWKHVSAQLQFAVTPVTWVHTSFCARWQRPRDVNRRNWGFSGKVGGVAWFGERIL
jgi:hypothetical protein